MGQTCPFCLFIQFVNVLPTLKYVRSFIAVFLGHIEKNESNQTESNWQQHHFQQTICSTVWLREWSPSCAISLFAL